VYVRGSGTESYEGLGSWGPVSAAWLVVEPGFSADEGEQGGTTSSRTRGGRPGR
jgi:hypothetical protein